MRRLLLALTVLSLILPATAQMRGGMRAGFAGRGFVGGHGRAGSPIVRPAGPRALGDFGFLGVNPRFRHRGFNRFGHRFPRNGFGCGFGNKVGFNTFGFGFNNGFCNAFGFGNVGFGYGLPLYLGDYDTDYNGTAYADHTLRYDDTRDREMNELLLDLRDQQRELDYLINNLQRGPQYQAPPQQQQQAPPPNQRPQTRPMGATAANEAQQPATTLVFKDGHRMDVQNYVIAKSTLTVLDGGRRQHIPLAQLDLGATQKANEDKGVPFKAPTTTVSLLCNPADPNISCAPHRAQSEAQHALTP
jgi:hypothetical protein